MKPKVLAYLNTYRRYNTTLTMALLSLINQTYKPDKIIVYDDNPEPVMDPNNVEHYKYLMSLCQEKGIEFWWEWAGKKGAHHNHEKANLLGFDFAWFIDDDNVAEPNVLEELMKEMKDGVGVVGGIIRKPLAGPLPYNATGKIEDVWNGQNIAWYKWNGAVRECEHLYSGFLYRCNIVHHDLRLSKKVFRGETMFTHSLFLKGYKLLCTPNAVTWHFESSTGGCRTPEEEATNQQMYNEDNQMFLQWLAFKKQNKKLYVLDSGLGDHYMFLQAFPLEKDAIYAVCYPDLFLGYNVISIAEAKKIVDIKDYDVYLWAERYNPKGHLIESFKQMYAHINHTR